jgi:hypothetical protein
MVLDKINGVGFLVAKMNSRWISFVDSLSRLVITKMKTARAFITNEKRFFSKAVKRLLNSCLFAELLTHARRIRSNFKVLRL